MSELRQDATTLDWIIIAKERAKRPDQFRGQRQQAAERPHYRADCPFCPGNEQLTPGATAQYNDGTWSVRVVPNKFPALTPVGDMTRREQGMFRSSRGYGMHEVIIETPRHNEFIPDLAPDHMETLITMYRERYHALKKDPIVKLIIIFKNHGEAAGTSLEHPHTQIVASPIVPPFIRRRYEVATQHYDNTGRCIHHDLLEQELAAGIRIVRETEQFVVLHPYASRYPFETWIMPREHRSSFGEISSAETADFARVLKDTLRRLSAGLGDPDYNFVIHTAPVDDEHKSYYLWHMQIIPRLTRVAGFELGSGIYINVALPEETAPFLRSIAV